MIEIMVTTTTMKRWITSCLRITINTLSIKKNIVFTYGSSDRSIDDEDYIGTSEESNNEQYHDKNRSKSCRRLRHYSPCNNDVYCSSKIITKKQIYQ